MTSHAQSLSPVEQSKKIVADGIRDNEQFKSIIQEIVHSCPEDISQTFEDFMQKVVMSDYFDDLNFEDRGRVFTHYSLIQKLLLPMITMEHCIKAQLDLIK